MKKYKSNTIIKVFLIFFLSVLCVVGLAVPSLLSKKSYAATGALTYMGDRYSTDLGYNMQAAENYYRFSVGTSISAADLITVNGIQRSSSNKVTVTLAMTRKDTGLNKGYAIYVAMFYRLEKYDYSANMWREKGWNFWFGASVHKSGSSHNFDGYDELNEMRSRGQYPEGTVYDVSGADGIDLRKDDGERITCKDLCFAHSIKGRLTDWANVDNTAYSFDLTEDGRYRIAITAIGWRWEMGESAGRRWNVDGNKKIISSEFVIDNTAPTGTLKTTTSPSVIVSNGGYVRTNVCFVWKGDGSSNTTATLDGNTYSSGTAIYTEGKHTIVLKDVIKSSEYTFVIDKTTPTGRLSGVIRNGYTNKDVLFEWDKPGENEAPVSAKISRNDAVGVTYISGTKITEEGKYKIVLSDLAGNLLSYSFTIDKTPPVGTLNGVVNGGYTNQNVYFSWDEDASATLNGEPYSSGKSIVDEGNYEIILTDLAGNTTSYTFVIDKTAPTGELATTQTGGFRFGRYTNGNVTFSWSDNKAVAKLNGAEYTVGEKITAENNYSIVLTDLANNSTTYTFVIDKTAPTGSFNSVNSNGYSKSNVTFTWSEDADKVSAKLNGVSYSKGQTVYNEGSYEIILTDLADNSTTYTFVIDKTAPTGTLYGVTNGGYTNGDVRFEWTDSNASATLNGSVYVSGRAVTAESVYKIILTDLADNSTTYTFVIDKTAPTGTLYGVTNGGYTNGDVRFEWTDSNASATLNGSVYVSGRAVTAESAYEIILTDLAKNSTKYIFTIDRTAPVIDTGVADGVHTSNDVYVVISDTYAFSSLYGRTDSNSYIAADTSFQSGRKFDIEGNYTIKAVDAAGNIAEKRFTLDKSAPVINSYNLYTNVEFTLTAQDKYGTVGAWEYRLNQGENKRYEGQTLTLGGGEEANGIWQIRVIDELGNTSNWNTVNYVYRQTFGNSDNIYNSFFVSSYYTVILSQKNYPTCFGTYTFEDFSSALSFATSKEWGSRVIVLDGGNSWNYVNISNENTRQIYTDRQELDAVIDKYARKNISDRKVIGQNGTVINNPTDSEGVTRDDALTRQLTELPGLLSGYNAYRYMLSMASYSFITPQSIVDGNKSTATIQFISDGISLRPGNEIVLEYGVNLSNLLAAEGEQGWYLVTERDICGNEERYLIYLDLEQPQLRANVTYGNQNKELLHFSQDFIDTNAEAMRYIEFDISSLADNIDDFVMLSIEGRNANIRYIWGDDIPVLNYENGYYGAYKITAYDRSRNVLEFTVYIAGAEPSLRHSSVTNDTSCTFTIQINDSYNEITDVKFYKEYFDGTRDRLYADSYNTPVSAENLVYKVNVGGKYVFEFTDLYGRTVLTNPIFYMKGLPSATLKGVKDGGLTKTDVGITYDKDVTLELYRLSDDGEWFIFERYETTQGISSSTAGITAGKETTGVYKALLYKTDDRNLFTEYTFEIDGIPPAVQILTEEGIGIVPETVTTQSFYVTWQESGYKAYYKKQGALSESQYSKDTLIIKPGIYVFTVYDLAKNELIFTVTLDNSVSYTLDGTYVLLDDGSYITRKSFLLTITEPYSDFTVTASNGITVGNGQRLDTDGTYIVSVTDLYGNSLSLSLIVDKLPPVPVIVSEDGTSLSNGVRTQNSFRVLCEEENITITFAQGNNAFEAYDGALLGNVGTYNFRLTDRVGNIAEITVTVDREVAYYLEGNYKIFDGVYYSRSYILVSPKEEVSKFSITSSGGGLVDNTKKISEEGNYDVKITDIAGNSVDLKLVIDKTAPKVMITAESNKELDGKTVTNEAFRLNCEEADAVLTYSFNGSKNMPYGGEWLNEPGAYTYTATDRIGNSISGVMTFDIEVKFAIDGKYTIFDDCYYSNSWLLVLPKEEMSSFTIVSENGTFADIDKRITAEGSYSVSLTDIAGNTVILAVIIDKTAPQLKIITASGNELTGGAVNEAFTAICEEAGAAIEISVDNGKYILYDGSQISDEGLYSFRITDRIGNSAESSVLINYNVMYEVQGAQQFKNGIYYSSSWLQITPQKDIAAFTIFDSFGKQYDTSKRLTEEGNYTARLTDSAGNEIELSLVIDKTAPKLTVYTESGQEIESGATTNEKLKIVCAEENVKLQYSYLKSDFSDYTGEWLSEQGKYTVTAVDFLGNKLEIIFYIDTEVQLSFSGTYVVDSFGNLISKSWLLATPGEDMKTFYVLADDGSEVGAGSKLSEEGEYTLFAEDMYGNKRNVIIVIDKTAPLITLEGVIESGATNTAVTVSCEEYSEIYYSLNGGNKLTLIEGALFEAEGRYIVTARDIVGNTATVTFTIDKHVEVASSVALSDGCIITGAVSFKFNEEISAILICDGEEMIYERGELSKPGNYALTVTDSCNNVKTFNFMILPSKAQAYSFAVDTSLRIVMEHDGQPVPVQAESGTLNLSENGRYSLRFYSETTSWALNLEVDNVAPEVILENTKKSVKISSPNKDGMTYTLYRNGEKISFNMADSVDITQKGSYRLVCEDDVGNVTEYTFIIDYLSAAAIALIVVVSALGFAAILTLILIRFRRKIF